MVLLAGFLHLISIKHDFLVSVGKVVHNLFVSLPENDFKELLMATRKMSRIVKPEAGVLYTRYAVSARQVLLLFLHSRASSEFEWPNDLLPYLFSTLSRWYQNDT